MWLTNPLGSSTFFLLMLNSGGQSEVHMVFQKRHAASWLAYYFSGYLSIYSTAANAIARCIVEFHDQQ